MTKKKYDEKLYLDMDPDEALERFINVDPQELQANLDKQKRKKKPPGAADKASPGGQSSSVVELRYRRKR